MITYIYNQEKRKINKFRILDFFLFRIDYHILDLLSIHLRHPQRPVETVIHGRGPLRLHPQVDERASQGHDDEDGGIVPCEEHRHYHHLAVVLLVPRRAPRRVQDEPDLVEPSALQVVIKRRCKVRTCGCGIIGTVFKRT